MTENWILISDIHGNYPSLQAVVDREGADSEFIVLGDIMGLNAYPDKTQALVQEVSDYTIAGNHDKAIFDYGEGHANSDKLSAFELNHTLDNLSTEQQNWMRSLDYLKVLTRRGERICLCHAYPYPSKASGYRIGNAGVRKSDVTAVASVVSDEYDWVFHGHTHTQYDLDCSKFGHDVHFVNPGSLGYDETYSVVDTATGEVTHKSVDIDSDEVEEHISKHLPDDCPPTSQWF